MGHLDHPTRFRWAYESYGLSKASVDEMTETLDDHDRAELTWQLMEKDEEHQRATWREDGLI